LTARGAPGTEKVKQRFQKILLEKKAQETENRKIEKGDPRHDFRQLARPKKFRQGRENHCEEIYSTRSDLKKEKRKIERKESGTRLEKT